MKRRIMYRVFAAAMFVSATGAFVSPAAWATTGYPQLRRLCRSGRGIGLGHHHGAGGEHDQLLVATGLDRRHVGGPDQGSVRRQCRTERAVSAAARRRCTSRAQPGRCRSAFPSPPETSSRCRFPNPVRARRSLRTTPPPTSVTRPTASAPPSPCHGRPVRCQFDIEVASQFRSCDVLVGYRGRRHAGGVRRHCSQPHEEPPAGRGPRALVVRLVHPDRDVTAAVATNQKRPNRRRW